MSMPSYSKGDVVLVRYPFTDLSGSKVRPAVVINGQHESSDLIFVPLTSRTSGLLSGEFVLVDYRSAGLNVASAAKRGIHTLEQRFVLQDVGRLTPADMNELTKSVQYWLNLP